MIMFTFKDVGAEFNEIQNAKVHTTCTQLVKQLNATWNNVMPLLVHSQGNLYLCPKLKVHTQSKGGAVCLL